MAANGEHGRDDAAEVVEHGFDGTNDYEDSRDALLQTFIFLRGHLPIRRR